MAQNVVKKICDTILLGNKLLVSVFSCVDRLHVSILNIHFSAFLFLKFIGEECFKEEYRAAVHYNLRFLLPFMCVSIAYCKCTFPLPVTLLYYYYCDYLVFETVAPLHVFFCCVDLKFSLSG